MARKLQNLILYAFFAAGAVLLFFGPPSKLTIRSLAELWDLGHILFFMVFTLLLYRHLPFLSRGTVLRQLLLLLGITIAFGLLVEILQSFMGRSLDVKDILKNELGSLLAFIFLIPVRKKINRMLRFALQGILVALLALQVWPFLRAAGDEVIARSQFPLLAGFEIPSETDRWSAGLRKSIDHSVARSGRSSLKIEFSTRKYAGIGLEYFPSDWRSFQFLQFSLFNPEADTLLMGCHVHDDLHRFSGHRYNDRFNRELQILPGWNDFRFSLSEIKSAPADREMDMSRIVNFRLFTRKLAKPHVLYLDDVRLTEPRQ